MENVFCPTLLKKKDGTLRGFPGRDPGKERSIMELITKAPKGTVDLVPGKVEKWQVMEDVFRS